MVMRALVVSFFLVTIPLVMTLDFFALIGFLGLGEVLFGESTQFLSLLVWMGGTFSFLTRFPDTTAHVIMRGSLLGILAFLPLVVATSWSWLLLGEYRDMSFIAPWVMGFVTVPFLVFLVGFFMARSDVRREAARLARASEAS